MFVGIEFLLSFFGFVGVLRRSSLSNGGIWSGPVPDARAYVMMHNQPYLSLLGFAYVDVRVDVLFFVLLRFSMYVTLA